jgi:hypothetical protein
LIATDDKEVEKNLGERQGDRTDLHANAGKSVETSDIAGEQAGFGQASTDHFALNLAGPPATYLKEDPTMKRAFLIIAVAVAMFGVAAISMAYHTHSKAYAYLRR